MSSYLENLLILFRLRLVELLDSLNILLNVDDGMFPCLKSLGKETGSLVEVIVSVLGIRTYTGHRPIDSLGTHAAGVGFGDCLVAHDARHRLLARWRR